MKQAIDELQEAQQKHLQHGGALPEHALGLRMTRHAIRGAAATGNDKTEVSRAKNAA